jgi:hypothetical protein
MRAQHLIVALGQGLGGFGKEPGRHFPSDSRQRQHNGDIRWPLTLARRFSQSAQQSTDLSTTGLKLFGEHAQTGQQERTMGLRRFGGARGHGQRWRL